MTGIDLVASASFVAEIGDINWFASANQLARFAGIAPVDVGSGGKVKHVKTSQGNRVLHELFFQPKKPTISKIYNDFLF
ncbi:IS110 family transposase [Paenibacillus sp. Soil766]|uniref:IS110 family transposase n=1 Tax=Paenibacillus sp. Soil766 TaxID=1736404 RepID=UPI001F15BC67|nr:IS110 family transposase [Paenibacillus sp. Soil766]